MSAKPVGPGAGVGDWIETHGVHGEARRKGTITELLGRAGHRRYRVRWDEQHESIVYPADGVIITPRSGREKEPELKRPDERVEDLEPEQEESEAVKGGKYDLVKAKGA